MGNLAQPFVFSLNNLSWKMCQVAQRKNFKSLFSQMVSLEEHIRKSSSEKAICGRRWLFQEKFELEIYQLKG
jgi:hypothetical protein